jgi:hypothetical protein
MVTRAAAAAAAYYKECISEIKEYQAAKRQRLVKDAFLHGTV